MAGQPGSPFAARARERGLEVREVSMRGEMNPAAVARVLGIVRRWRPDIVHMHTSHAHTLGVLACRASNIGRTVVSRRVDFSIHRSPLRLNLLKYRFCVDRFIAISEGVRRVMVEDGIPPGKIEVVPSGVDLAELDAVPRREYREEFRIPASAPVVGDVAHFGWHKAQEVLVEACPLLWREEPELRVILVGDGECRPKVEAAARRMGADGRLVFAGHREDARSLIRWFDVFVMCSVKEGLCTSILDAHALRTPVVASRVGGIPEVVRHEATGLLVPPRDPGALAAAVLRVLREPERARARARAGRKLVEERYSVEAMVEGTLGVYRRVLEGRGA